MRSCKLPIKQFSTLAILLLALSSAAFADKKSDLYAKGVKSMLAGGSQDVMDARDAFCQVQKEDAEYTDGTNGPAQKLCTDMTNAANKILQLNKVHYGEGQDLLAAGKLDEAENKFKTVRFGEYVPAAKNKLTEIAKLRQDKQNADAQNKTAADQANALNTKFEQGSAAFNTGNFDAAKASLSGLTGPHAAEASDMMAKINRYESLMSQAATYAQNKNFGAAMNAYNSAGAINSKGPGNPFGKADEMNNLLSSAAPSNNSPSNTSPTSNRNIVAAADKDRVEKVDEAKLVADAQQLIAKGKIAQARKNLNKVLAQNLKNKAAQDLVNSLPQEAPQTTSASTVTQEDPVLAAAIREFYKGNYEDAENALSYYLNQGKKPGLGNFYIGVSVLTRYFLGGETDQSLRLKAMKRFSSAKDVQGFKPPEKLVSPKILAIYNTSKPSVTATP